MFGEWLHHKHSATAVPDPRSKGKARSARGGRRKEAVDLSALAWEPQETKILARLGQAEAFELGRALTRDNLVPSIAMSDNALAKAWSHMRRKIARAGHTDLPPTPGPEARFYARTAFRFAPPR